MSEIDPWALPQGAAVPTDAGIPVSAAPRPAFIPAAPLNRTLPIVVIGLGVLYVLVSLAQVFALDHDASLASQLLANPFSVSVGQAQSADDAVNSVSVATFVVFIGTLVAIGAWQRSLNATLGSIGARQAVFRRAGYAYFRGTWLVSLLLSVALQATNTNAGDQSVQDVINHDHDYMVYYGLRALVGVVLIFFALRLKKMSEEGVARLAGGYAGA
jgi:hypothetical protein